MDLNEMRVGPPLAWGSDTHELVLEIDQWIQKGQNFELSSSSEWTLCFLLKPILLCRTACVGARNYHPLYPCERSQEEVQELVPFLMKVQKTAAENAPESRSSYFDRLLLTISYIIGSNACEDMSHELLARYEAKRGPSWNSELQTPASRCHAFFAWFGAHRSELDHTYTTGRSWNNPLYWNEVEAQCPLKPSAEAAQFYEDALEFY